MGAGDEGSQVIQRRNAGPLGVIGISGVALEVRLADRGAKVVALGFGNEPRHNAPARPLAFELVCSD